MFKIALLSPKGPLYRHRTGIFRKSLRMAPLTLTTLAALLPDDVPAEVTLIDACSGVDGTWGMQKRFHAESMKVARKMLDAIEAAEPEHVSTDCPLSALRIEEGTGHKAVHPVVLLRHAFGLGTP